MTGRTDYPELVAQAEKAVAVLELHIAVRDRQDRTGKFDSLGVTYTAPALRNNIEQ